MAATSFAVGEVTQTRWERVRGFLAKPVDKPFNLLVIGLALATLWGWSLPGGPGIGVFLLTTLGWEALGGYWLARILASFGIVGWRPFLTRRSLGFVIAPVAFFLTAALVVFNIPDRVRFEASQKAMDQMAAEVLDGHQVPDSTSIGLYRVTDVEVVGGDVRFIVEAAGFIDRFGFQYSPDGRPKKRGVFQRSWHMDGPWWMVQEEF